MRGVEEREGPVGRRGTELERASWKEEEREGRSAREREWVWRRNETNLVPTENLDLILPLLPFLSHNTITSCSLVQSGSERLGLLSEVLVDLVRSRSSPS